MSPGERASDEMPVATGPRMKLGDRILQRWRIAKVRPFIPLDARILDIGCHEGALFRVLGSSLGSGVGVDPALEKDVATQRYRLVAREFPCELPESEPFDVVTLLAVVEHLSPGVLREVQSECVRLLRPGGAVLITVPSPAVDRILRWLIRLRIIAGTATDQHHGFEPADVPAIFGRPGLPLEQASRFQLGLNNLFVFRRMAECHP